MSRYIITKDTPVSTNEHKEEWFTLIPGDVFDIERMINGVCHLYCPNIYGKELKVFAKVNDLKDRYKINTREENICTYVHTAFMN